jgi:hypothetical protein
VSLADIALGVAAAIGASPERDEAASMLPQNLHFTA